MAKAPTSQRPNRPQRPTGAVARPAATSNPASTQPRRAEPRSRPALPEVSQAPPRKTQGGPTSSTLRVQATRLGYYGEARRRAGDVFTLTDAKDFAKWMRWVSPQTRERITTGAAELQRIHDEVIGGTVTRLDGPAGTDDDIL